MKLILHDYLKSCLYSDRYFLTYESLSDEYAAYERLDKCRKFVLNQ